MFHSVSLFSNCGAGDVGYRDAGFRFEVMAEIDEYRRAVCLANHPSAEGVAGDLSEPDVWGRVVDEYRSRCDEPPALLAACPPCQGMSSARGRGVDDERNLLAEVVGKVAIEVEPQLIVVENVAQFLTRKVPHPEAKNSAEEETIVAAHLLVEMLHENYQVFPVLLDLDEYGVPQARKRTFLTFVRRENPACQWLVDTGRAPYPRPTHASDHGGEERLTLRAFLESLDLPELDARSEEGASRPDFDRHHFVPVWDDYRYGMVAAIPPDGGGSAWENTCTACGSEEAGEDEAICRACGEELPRPRVTEKDGSVRLVKGFRTSSYRRMKSHQPASTITTGSGHLGSHNTIHPWQNRLLSPYECARLQTFPTDFEWTFEEGGKEVDAMRRFGATNVRAMIGEAVPPHFTRMHGEVLFALIDEGEGPEASDLLPLEDKRCERARRKLGLPNPRDVFSEATP